MYLEISSFLRVNNNNKYYSTFQHPFIHPIERIDYLVDHRLLVMVQPQRNDGSLKDMIYNVRTLALIIYTCQNSIKIITVNDCMCMYFRLVIQDFFDNPLPEIQNFDPASVSQKFQHLIQCTKVHNYLYTGSVE